MREVGDTTEPGSRGFPSLFHSSAAGASCSVGSKSRREGPTGANSAGLQKVNPLMLTGDAC